MEKKDDKEGYVESKGLLGTAGDAMQKARSTIVRTLSAVASGFTDMSGGTVPPQNKPIPAPAPPAASSGGAQSNVSQGSSPAPKQPTNVKGLLRMCAELTNSHTAGADADNTRMTAEESEERTKFLKEAISQVTGGRTVIDDLKDSIKQLDSGLDENTEEIGKNLDNLQFVSYHVDDLDLANDFLKIGGLGPVMKGLKHCQGPVRKESYNILAVVAQNNPFAWSFYENHQVLPAILERLVTETYEDAFDSGFSAVSCLIRGNKNAILMLKANNGEDLIYTVLLTSERTRTLRKAGYILRSLIVFDRENNGQGAEVRGFYKAILQELCDRIRLKKGSRDVLGAVLQVVYYILSEHEELVQNYLKPEVGLLGFVEEVLQVEPNDDDPLEVMETYNAASDLKPILDAKLNQS